MEQTSINQRLIFLLDKLKVSARTFSEMIGESPTNTQNYVGTRAAEPRAGYLENVLRHFKTINALWLLTGEGDPFIPGTDEPFIIYQKNNSGQRIKNNHGTATNNSYTIADCEKERDTYKAERDLARAENELLRQQLTMAQALLEAKDETLSLLRAGHNRPN